MRPRVCKAVPAEATRRARATAPLPEPPAERTTLRRRLLGSACVALPLLCGGCSLPIIAFKPVEPTEAASVDEPAATGSLPPRAPLTFGRDLDAEDWRRASAALAVALDPQGNGKPVKWDNPETGRRGAINPTGLPFVRDDAICRNFLASVVTSKGSRFLRGTGCRLSGAPWELKSLKAAKSES
jgi:surface antigen